MLALPRAGRKPPARLVRAIQWHKARPSDVAAAIAVVKAAAPTLSNLDAALSKAVALLPRGPLHPAQGLRKPVDSTPLFDEASVWQALRVMDASPAPNAPLNSGLNPALGFARRLVSSPPLLRGNTLPSSRRRPFRRKRRSPRHRMGGPR